MAKYGVLARLALLGATLIWGSTFIILKSALDDIPTYFILAFRFLVAAVALSLIFVKRWKNVNKSCLWQGALLAAFYAAAYIFQTIGLKNTTPGKNAFLTTVYCVLVPFIVWALYRKRPDKFNVIAAITCLTGIGLVSLDGAFVVQFGDYMTLVGGVFYALHIVALASFTRKNDAVMLTTLQFWFSFVICAVMSLATEQFPQSIPSGAWVEMIYLAVFGSTIAMLLQSLGQKYLSSSSAAIILSLESVFGVMFSIIFAQEALNLQVGCGFALIFIAVIISETKLDFLRKKKTRPPDDLT